MKDARLPTKTRPLPPTPRNGGGDLYYTDGEVWILRLVQACQKRDGPAVTIASPAATEIKDEIWRGIAEALGN